MIPACTEFVHVRITMSCGHQETMCVRESTALKMQQGGYWLSCNYLPRREGCQTQRRIVRVQPVPAIRQPAG